MSEEKNPEQDTSSEQEKEMFSATCSECGKEAKVPFEPKEDRPVRCEDCFKKYIEKKKQNRNKGKRLFDAKCAKCGKPCKVPFRPNGKKPVLCRDCFQKENN